jgi:hypothetical protein
VSTAESHRRTAARVTNPFRRARTASTALHLLTLVVLGWSSACLSTDTTAILPGAPAILTQPVARTVTVGDAVTLSVVTSGDSIAYQWYHDNAKVDGATAGALSIAAARSADAGLYFVVVSNPIGTIVSDTARLVVNVPPAIVGYTLTAGDVTSTNEAYTSVSADQSAVNVAGTANLTLINPTVTKSGAASSISSSQRTGVNAGVRATGGTVVIVDGTIATTGAGASALFSTGGGTRVSMTRGMLNATGASSYAAGATQGATLELTRTRLRAASGTLIAAADGGTVSFLAEGDSLAGNVVADASSSITLSLTKGSSLSGAVQLAGVSLDSTSTWNVTAPSAVTVFADPLLLDAPTLANVIGNGFTVTYDAARPENAALGGRTYALAGGGSLAPR